MVDWKEISKSVPSAEILRDMQALYALRGSRDQITEKRRLRKSLRDAGYLSLPFSMNIKKS